MKKKNKIIYWIATIWLSLGLLAGGLQQIFHTKNFVDMFAHLGYPLYFMTIIGIWKILGAVAILTPRFVLIKEWAYAGIFILWSGALLSHIASGDPLIKSAPALILIILTLASWYFRPKSRKLISFTSQNSKNGKS